MLHLLVDSAFRKMFIFEEIILNKQSVILNKNVIFAMSWSHEKTGQTYRKRFCFHPKIEIMKNLYLEG